MSLTSHLADRASPVHQFFAGLVPLAANRTAARELNTEARMSMLWGGPLVVAGTVPTLAGSAFDFGFRHWVSPFDPDHQPRVAVVGARLAGAHGWTTAPALLQPIIEALPTRGSARRCQLAPERIFWYEFYTNSKPAILAGFE